jgi:hypothetical protein
MTSFRVRRKGRVEACPAKNPQAAGEEGEGPLAEPDEDLALGHPEESGGGPDQPDELLIRVAPDGRVGPIQTGAVQDGIPRRLPVLLPDDFFQEIEHDPLHGTRSLQRMIPPSSVDCQDASGAAAGTGEGGERSASRFPFTADGGRDEDKAKAQSRRRQAEEVRPWPSP